MTKPKGGMPIISDDVARMATLASKRMEEVRAEHAAEVASLKARVAELEAALAESKATAESNAVRGQYYLVELHELEEEHADRLEVLKREHDETRGYRQHAEQLVAELTAENAKLRASIDKAEEREQRRLSGECMECGRAGLPSIMSEGREICRRCAP